MKHAIFLAGLALAAISACTSNGGGAFKTSSPMLANSPENLKFATVDDGNWAVVTHATGQATASQQSITISLNDFTTLANPEIPVRIIGYRVCIAYQISAREWDMAACSKLVKHRVTMQPGQSETLDPATLVIPAKRLSKIGQSWFAVDVQVLGPNLEIGHNYAHSEILP